MTIALRQAVASDAAAIRDLTRAAYAKWVPVIGREPKPMTVDYDAAVRRDRFDLLFIADALAALIQTVQEADHLLIENVAVRPGLQGRGLGRRLLAQAEDLARRLGFQEARLFTNGAFAENIALYRHLGYRVTLEEPFLDGTVVHMTKTLDQSSPLSA